MAFGISSRLFIIVLLVPIISSLYGSFNNSSKEDSILQQHSLLCQAFDVEFEEWNYDCGSYQSYDDDDDFDEDNDDSNNAEDEEDEEEELEKKSEEFIAKVRREWREKLIRERLILR